MARRYHVYIMADQSRSHFVGVTTHLYRRWLEHRTAEATERWRDHHFTRLVYAETYVRAVDAFEREKELAKWNRQRIQRLVESLNPGVRDLAVVWGWRAKPASMLALGANFEMEHDWVG